MPQDQPDPGVTVVGIELTVDAGERQTIAFDFSPARDTHRPRGVPLAEW